jgi:hypothetical protein
MDALRSQLEDAQANLAAVAQERDHLLTAAAVVPAASDITTMGAPDSAVEDTATSAEPPAASADRGSAADPQLSSSSGGDVAALAAENARLAKEVADMKRRVMVALVLVALVSMPDSLCACSFVEYW